jgi:hypothetical protein
VPGARKRQRGRISRVAASKAQQNGRTGVRGSKLTASWLHRFDIKRLPCSFSKIQSIRNRCDGGLACLWRIDVDKTLLPEKVSQ